MVTGNMDRVVWKGHLRPFGSIVVNLQQASCENSEGAEIVTIIAACGTGYEKGLGLIRA